LFQQPAQQTFSIRKVTLLMRRRILRRCLLSSLLISHALLNRRQFLQLIGRENSFDLWSARLANRQELLLLLLETHRVVIPDCGNLFVLVIYHRGNFLLLIWSELQLVIN